MSEPDVLTAHERGALALQKFRRARRVTLRDIMLVCECSEWTAQRIVDNLSHSFCIAEDEAGFFHWREDDQVPQAAENTATLTERGIY